VSRYTRVQRLLEQYLFNAPYNLVDPGTHALGSMVFTCVDLFAGCGGLALGFEKAGFKSELAVEMDRDAAATYRRNFPQAMVWADRIENLSDEELRNIMGDQTVHAILAGFPCQGFSVAGQRNPRDERNVLFRQVIRFADVLRPWFVVMENVPGIVTISHSKVFDAIYREFGEIGYRWMSALVLEPAAFGVPQFRPRVIFVANRFGLPNAFPKLLLEPKDYVPIEAAIDDLKLLPRDPSINHDWTYHSPEMEQRIAQVEPGGSLYDSYYDAWKRQYRGVPAMTIKENHGGTHIHYELNRTLSAREMARLQSFPDDFLFEGRMKRVMFQIGNAVPPLLAYHVALALRPTLEALSNVSEESGEERIPDAKEPTARSTR
jgi:DNA (cytosine-5)-methyltransferase 1